MATRVIDDTKLNNIAVAIQAKDSGGQMTVDEMPTRIANIPSGGTLIQKTITQNGVYNASSDNADGYDVVTVDVPEKNTLDDYFANTLEVADISSATSIIIDFFRNKSSLINVIMPNVTSIGNNAFYACSKLALTSLPSGVTSIGNNAFQGCTNLALTVLPDGITSIGDGTFNNCTSIPYLDFSNFTQIPTVSSNSFINTSFPFYFRDQQQLDEWAAATNWSTYAGRFQIKPSGVI